MPSLSFNTLKSAAAVASFRIAVSGIVQVSPTASELYGKLCRREHHPTLPGTNPAMMLENGNSDISVKSAL